MQPETRRTNDQHRAINGVIAHFLLKEEHKLTVGIISHEDAIRIQWDVIVIGAGMGGATLGHALARGGKRVLFCEKGKSSLGSQDSLRGSLAEMFFEPPDIPRARHRSILSNAGRYSEELIDISHGQELSFVPFIGSGSGGSSALYGAALERFFPADFEPRKHHPLAVDSTLPDKWPISFQQLEPYYEFAERLYRVHGATDPSHPSPRVIGLRPSPPLRSGTQELVDYLSASNLHPYRLPQACEFVTGCTGCQGYLCPLKCKNDAGRICLLPALEEHGARLLTECNVIRLESAADRITEVVCETSGKEYTLHGEIVVLAAGAIATPRLLLASANKEWPTGLANDSGLVGRNLMRHYVDLYAIKVQRKDNYPSNLKEIAFNDLYVTPTGKFGTVQSFGAMPPPEVIAEELGWELNFKSNGWLTPFYSLAKPVVRKFLQHAFSKRIVLASIMEDLPYQHNRVELAAPREGRNGGGIAIQYTINEFERKRIELFRDHLSGVFDKKTYTLIKQAENNARIAHCSGTCRFGNDPLNSVLDPSNRAHRISNLYVIDSSFFPSSGGTNPALTIAANALRVADIMLFKTPAL